MEPVTENYRDALRWSDGAGDIEADMRAALKKLETWTPQESRLVSIDVAPSIYRDVEQLVRREMELGRAGSPLLYVGLLVRSNPEIPATVMFGRDRTGRVIGVYLAGRGWWWHS